MSGNLPPLGGHAPPLHCNRLLRWPDESTRCAKDAKWHVIWTDVGENGLMCDEHREEVAERWKPLAIHAYRMECSMPGAFFVFAENVCVVDEGLLGLTESSALEAAL